METHLNILWKVCVYLLDKMVHFDLVDEKVYSPFTVSRVEVVCSLNSHTIRQQQAT